MKHLGYIVILFSLITSCESVKQERKFKQEKIEEISINANNLISVNPGNT